MKSTKDLEKFRGLDIESLEKEKEACSQSLFSLKFQKASNKIESTAEISSLRKTIARINTVIRQKQDSAEQ